MSESPGETSLSFAERVPFRLGIVGGMGPLAGVYLQQLIIEATPAGRDQDHLEVVCFTNPHIPERMHSLAEDGGRRYAAAVRGSVELVVRAGATHVLIACNTAHARLREIQAGIDVPILDMIRIGLAALVRAHGPQRRVGLLATRGTLDEQVYQRAADGLVAGWVVPGDDDQAVVSDAILGVKAGEAERVVNGVVDVCRRLADRGAEVVVVGCTELSVCWDGLGRAGVPLVDPLRAAAREAVRLGVESSGRNEWQRRST
jgi:aspartate racemase